ncbi:hypothetical protein, partial [Bifidobacterium mongoliense]|uniref:hypothetical protein n=1 Tax=Bifidobacterium mongoliense TaxID=518643 RepID=UPI002647AF92
RLVVLGASRSQRSARVDTAARSWSLPYRAVDPRETKMSGAAPVVTWGEWQAFDHGWKNRTVLDLARLIAGMPA